MFSVTRILAIAVLASSGVAAASSASSTTSSTTGSITSTRPTASASRVPAPSASKKPNAAVPVSKAAPAVIIGGIMFAGANLAFGL